MAMLVYQRVSPMGSVPLNILRPCSTLDSVSLAVLVILHSSTPYVLNLRSIRGSVTFGICIFVYIQQVFFGPILVVYESQWLFN